MKFVNIILITLIFGLLNFQVKSSKKSNQFNKVLAIANPNYNPNPEQEVIFY